MALTRKKKALIRRSYKLTRANKKPPVRAEVVVRDIAAKLLILETFIRISARTKLKKPFTARYQQRRKTLFRRVSERFQDGKMFERSRVGDCADATVHFGARLRQRGIDAFPVLQWHSKQGRRILHALLYLPEYGVVVDPTFIYFPKWRGKGAIVRQLSARDLAGIHNQMRQLYGD
jgi:hypothetical protein